MTDHDIRDGRISYEQFVIACDKFLILAREINDPWKAEGDPTIPGDRFLTVTYTRRMPVSNARTDDDHKEPVAAPLVQFRYDVVYSICHATPVLYFMVSRPCGSFVSLDEIWLAFSSTTGGRKNDMWDIVSPQYHPVLNTAFFCVHPCDNWKLLSECYGEQSPTCEEYLISWLSIVGNSFGLKLSNKYVRPTISV